MTYQCIVSVVKYLDGIISNSTIMDILAIAEYNLQILKTVAKVIFYVLLRSDRQLSMR